MCEGSGSRRTPFGDTGFLPLHYAMFEDSSPAPVKYALSRVHDWMNDSVRLPLTACSEAARKAVDEALVHAGLLENA